MCPYPDMLFIEAGAPIDLQKSALRYFQSLKEKTNEIMPTNLRKIDSGTCVVFFQLCNIFQKSFCIEHLGTAVSLFITGNIL